MEILPDFEEGLTNFISIPSSRDNRKTFGDAKIGIFLALIILIFSN